MAAKVIEKKADVSVLDNVAEKAKAYYVEQLEKRIGQMSAKEKAEFRPTAVEMEDLETYIQNSIQLNYIRTNSGWGHCKRNLILEIKHEKITYCAIFFYQDGSCSACDADRVINWRNSCESLENAIKNVTDDLVNKIKSGHIYSCLDELIRDQQRKIDNYNDELYKKLACLVSKEDIDINVGMGKFEDPVDAYHMQFGHPEPSNAILGLIKKEKPSSLREILMVMGLEKISMAEVNELGTVLSSKLPDRLRKKTEVVKDGKKMMVVLYEPYEFGFIEPLILQHLKGK